MDEVFPTDARAVLPRDAEEQERHTVPAPAPTAVFAGVAVSAATHVTLSLLALAALTGFGTLTGLLAANGARGGVCLVSLSLAVFIGAAVAGHGSRNHLPAAGMREGLLVWAIGALVLFLAISAGFDAAAGFDPRATTHALPPFVAPDVTRDADGAPGLLTLLGTMSRIGRFLVGAMLVLTSLGALLGGIVGARLRADR